MTGRITISNPQNIVKDTYAPAPKIDLTLRANGEEAVMVMNALAQWQRAGFDAPPNSPSVTALGTAGTFPATKYWRYAYVYVAKQLYPLVENAVTGGGSPAPRSNPSPSSAADSTVNTNGKRLDIPTSQRSDISHIWLYRTEYFDTAAEATDFATAGNMFWIAEVENNANLLTVPYVDSGAAVGLEQIENDNFPAPLFDKGVYSDPFFWGFGNSIFEAPVSITSTGLVTLTDIEDKWYDGRNSQIITFVGITSGGFDNHGSFYFKQIDNQTAQLYQNIGLTSPIGVSQIGTTIATIRGPSTVLYRSKPRNPFSWGQTDLVGDVQIPEPYQFSVGGGNGTAIAVIPNLNLLKLDTESPNRCYTLNLKNAGTPNFETSLRAIADNYCVSNHHSQFSSILDRGQNVLWGIDSKGFAVIECDGSSQQPVSSMVFETLRNISTIASDRLLFHGCYCPRLELNCLFFRAGGGLPLPNISKMVYQHSPTGFWGTADVYDILCSAQIFDRFDGQMKMFVGTETGFVGELFAADRYHNWVTDTEGTDVFGAVIGVQRHGLIRLSNAAAWMEVMDDAPGFTDVLGVNIEGIIGNWMTLRYSVDGGVTFNTHALARVSNIQPGGRRVDFDLVYRVVTSGYFPSTIPTFDGIANPLNVGEYYLGLNLMEVGRSFNAQMPMDTKKIEEIWTTWRNTEQVPELEFTDYYINIPVFAPGAKEKKLQVCEPTSGSSIVFEPGGQYAMKTPLDVDLSKLFGIILRDRSYSAAQLMNYELRLTDLDHGN